MVVTCPKCSHVRPPDASNPEWQCPSCGVCYAKVGQAQPLSTRSARTPRIDAESSGNFGWLFKIVLLFALVWGASLAFQNGPGAPANSDTVAPAQPDTGDGKAFVNGALQVSEADVGLLKTLSGRLESACARNQYGLTETACIARLREREDACATTTARRHPGQIGDTDRMQIITQAYVACIFD